MSLRNSAYEYGHLAKIFHWLIFILLAFMIVYGYFLDDIPKPYQPAAYNIHKLTGLLILVLMLLRGSWALINIKPTLPANHRWENLTERTVHGLLYIVVIAMPLAGWIGSTAAGHPPRLGSFNMLLPIVQNKAVANVAFTLHGYLAIAIIVLVSIHVLAALFHHCVRKDNVLRRMI